MNELATIQQQEPSVGAMLQTFIDRGITSENVAAFGQLVELKERLDAKSAERAFSAAFVELQRETPVIVASSEIPNRGKYERYEDVMRVVGPLLIKNGFAVSFRQQADDKRITVTCRLMHTSGHFSETPFAVRLGGRADSDTQADCKASTTAKRNALLQALNIVIRQDVFQDEDNAVIEGDYISAQEAENLREWVESLNADVKKFLEFAEAESFETIRQTKLDTLQEALKKLEKRKK